MAAGRPLAGKRTKWRIEDFRRIARERGGRCLSRSARSVAAVLRWRCADGHIWKAPASSVVSSGTWCPRCRAVSGNPWSKSRLYRLIREPVEEPDWHVDIERLAERSAAVCEDRGRPQDDVVAGWLALGDREAPDPETALIERERADLLRAMLTRIAKRDAGIVGRWYALTGVKETLDEIASSLRITRERVRQILLRAVRRLREHGHRLSNDEENRLRMMGLGERPARPKFMRPEALDRERREFVVRSGLAMAPPVRSIERSERSPPARPETKRLPVLVPRTGRRAAGSGRPAPLFALGEARTLHDSVDSATLSPASSSGRSRVGFLGQSHIWLRTSDANVSAILPARAVDGELLLVHRSVSENRELDRMRVDGLRSECQGLQIDGERCWLFGSREAILVEAERARVFRWGLASPRQFPSQIVTSNGKLWTLIDDEPVSIDIERDQFRAVPRRCVRLLPIIGEPSRLAAIGFDGSTHVLDAFHGFEARAPFTGRRGLDAIGVHPAGDGWLAIERSPAGVLVLLEWSPSFHEERQHRLPPGLRAVTLAISHSSACAFVLGETERDSVLVGFRSFDGLLEESFTAPLSIGETMLATDAAAIHAALVDRASGSIGLLGPEEPRLDKATASRQ